MTIQRIIAQSLEAWRLSGVTDLPHLDVKPTAVAASSGAVQQPVTVQQPISDIAQRSRGLVQPRAPLQPVAPAQPHKTVQPPDVAASLPAVAEDVSAGPFDASNPPTETIQQNESEPEMARKRATSKTTTRAPDLDRAAALQILAERVADCRKCKELASTRTQTVFGVGNPNARIVFVGEAPGADEDRQGEPFVGRAGQLLNKIIEACKLRRDEIYICNILKCRPPENRTPLPDECSNCREFLEAQLETIAPEYIVCWGTVAAQNLLNATTPISKLRGRFFEYGTSKVLCTYHPSYLLRNPPAKKDVWEDMKLLFRDMGVELT